MIHNLSITLKSDLDKVERVKNQGGHNATTDPGVEMFKPNVTQQAYRCATFPYFGRRGLHFGSTVSKISRPDLHTFASKMLKLQNDML